MRKRSVKEMRRGELMDAAIAVIGEEGLARATLASIAARAGMSTALASHYFESKDELLALAMRNLSTLFRKDILDVMPSRPTPEQRLRAIIDGSFSPNNFTLPKREAWVQFMVNALHDPQILKLYRLTGARFVSNLRFAVRPLVEPNRVEAAADGIAAMIDGFFWQMAIDRDDDDFLYARRICWNYACSQIPRLEAS